MGRPGTTCGEPPVITVSDSESESDYYDYDDDEVEVLAEVIREPEVLVLDEIIRSPEVEFVEDVRRNGEARNSGGDQGAENGGVDHDGGVQEENIGERLSAMKLSPVDSLLSEEDIDSMLSTRTVVDEPLGVLRGGSALRIASVKPPLPESICWSDFSDTEVDITIPPYDSEEEEKGEETGEDTTAQLHANSSSEPSTVVSAEDDSSEEVDFSIPPASDQTEDSELDADNSGVEKIACEAQENEAGEFFGEPAAHPDANLVADCAEKQDLITVEEMKVEVPSTTFSTTSEGLPKEEESQVYVLSAVKVEEVSGELPKVSPTSPVMAAAGSTDSVKENQVKERKELRITYVHYKANLKGLTPNKIKRLKGVVENRMLELSSHCTFESYKPIHKPLNIRSKPGDLYPKTYEEQDEDGREYVKVFHGESIREEVERKILEKNLNHVKQPSGPTPTYLEVMGCTLPRNTIPKRLRTLPRSPSPKPRPSQDPNLYPSSDEEFPCLYPTYSEWERMSEKQKTNIGRVVGDKLQAEIIKLEEEKEQELVNKQKALEEKKCRKRSGLGLAYLTDVKVEMEESEEGVTQRQTRLKTGALKRTKLAMDVVGPAEVTKVAHQSPRQADMKEKLPDKMQKCSSNKKKRSNSVKIPAAAATSQNSKNFQPNIRTGWLRGNEWKVERLVDVRVIRDGRGNDITQYRIKWLDWPSCYNNWENCENVSSYAKQKFWKNLKKEVLSKNAPVTLFADPVALEEENVESVIPRYMDLSDDMETPVRVHNMQQ